MDTQTAYENIRAYFSREGAVLAKSEQGFCSYRTTEGNKCAVGALIPDEMYVSDMECGMVYDLLEEFPIVKDYLRGVDESFLIKAQSLHDHDASDAPNFVARLDFLADQFELELHPDAAW